MKFQLSIALIITFFSVTSTGQNLVVNGGFEPPDCDLPAWNIDKIIPPWKTLNGAGYWQKSFTLYYGPCTSRSTAMSIPARTGDGHIGLPVYGEPSSTDDPHQSRGYAVGTLTEPLKSGQLYQVTYWTHVIYDEGLGVRRGTNAPGVLFVNDTNDVYFDDLHVLISDQAIYPPEPLLEYGKWVQVCLTFVADGGEKYIILGNFRRNEDSNIKYLNPDIMPIDPQWDWGYYMIDDLFLQPYKPINPAIPATANICPNGEIQLTARTGLNGTWDDESTENRRIITEPGAYSYTYLDGTCVRTDICEVVEVNCTECSVYLPSAFTPNGDGLNDIWKPEFECDIANYRLEIFDRQGNLVFKTFDVNVGWTPSTDSPLGVYAVRVRMTYELHGETTFIDKMHQITLLR